MFDGNVKLPLDRLYIVPNSASQGNCPEEILVCSELFLPNQKQSHSQHQVMKELVNLIIQKKVTGLTVICKEKLSIKDTAMNQTEQPVNTRYEAYLPEQLRDLYPRGMHGAQQASLPDISHGMAPAEK